MATPKVGEIVRVRTRQYLVEDVAPPPAHGDSTRVRLACVEDDAQGEPLEVLWEREVDARRVEESPWSRVASRGFDDPRHFSAYLHTLRWSRVTSTNPKLLQAPYRAGIEVKAYQLEPLRKALEMPLVRLFIADDVGLGKTIEAGLILRELLIRQKVQRVVIAAPPSVVRQWQEEMEQRFGLTFVILDRDYVSRKRRERGYGVNPWRTHSRFIISHALLRDESYKIPLQDWLDHYPGGSMLILDEAHNAAPASGVKYGIDSKLTGAVRDIAERFEHRVFLSATPHNGHSNSFAALLEILDPNRFCRGVPVRDPKLLDDVMVRRLKKDLRDVETGFPERKVLKIVIDRLADDAPELALSRLLQRYRELREERLKDETRHKRAAAMLVVVSLQKRLLSSIEAFARTLRVHRRALAKQVASDASRVSPRELGLLRDALGPDDPRAELPEEEVEKEEDAQTEASSQAAASAAAPGAEELRLLGEMTAIAERARHDPDPRLHHLIDWLRKNACPRLGEPDAPWLPRRVLIFTEFADTKRWVAEQLEAAIAGSDRDDERISTFHGGMGDDRREELKASFNADPERDPLRVLVATDAAREGVNLQNHCADLFHFDVPWNPGRMEQRNGRIDRKLQRAPEVRCHYFVLPQRPEDRVIDVLVRKTDTIIKELGTLSPVVERKMSSLLADGIHHESVGTMTSSLEEVDRPGEEPRTRAIEIDVIAEELETVRQRRDELTQQIQALRNMLDSSKTWLGLSDTHFRNAISASLELLKAPALEPVDAHAAAEDPARARWVLPPLDQRHGADPSWAVTLDALRGPKPRGRKLAEWRAETPIRPIVFRDPGSLDGEVVHLHLEHRVVQRLLGRFRSQGFVHDELSRACVLLTDDAHPHVVVLGRLSLYGGRASRLHDEIVAVAARWAPPDGRGRGLRPVREGVKDDVLDLIEQSLASPRLRSASEAIRARFADATGRDVEELLPHLERRASTLAERAEKRLAERGARETKDLRAVLEAQKKRIQGEMREAEDKRQLELGFNREAVRQREADKRHWARRLQTLNTDIVDEPRKVERTYVVEATQVTPVGVVYLWPVSS